MKKRRASLSTKILSLCFWLVVIVAIAISLIFMININRLTVNSLKEQALVTMEYLDANLLQVLTNYTDLVETTAAIFDYAITHSSPEEMEEAFLSLAETVPDVLSLYYGHVGSRHAPGGFYIDSSGWEPPYEWDPPNRIWFQEAMENPDKIMIVDPYVDEDTGELVVSVSRTVRNSRGSIIGVVAIDVLLDKLAELVLAEKITEDGSTFLIDEEGLFIVHPDRSFMIEKNIYEEMPHIEKSFIHNYDANVIFSGNIFQGQTYICTSPLHGTSWAMISIGSLKELEAESRSILGFVVIIALVIALISAVIALFFSRSLTSPFKHLVTNFELYKGSGNTSRFGMRPLLGISSLHSNSIKS